MSRESIHGALMERVATLSAYGTSGATVVAGWSMQEWFGVIGLIFMVLTFIINTYYRRKTYQHQVFMQEKALRDEAEENGYRGG
jgi:hypothetical protein